MRFRVWPLALSAFTGGLLLLTIPRPAYAHDLQPGENPLTVFIRS